MSRLWAQLFACTVPFNHITAWVSVFIVSAFYKTRLRDIRHKHMVTIMTSLSTHLCKSLRGSKGCRKNSGYSLGGSPFPALPLRFVYCSKDHLRGPSFLPGQSLNPLHSQATRKYGLRDCETPPFPDPAQPGLSRKRHENVLGRVGMGFYDSAKCLIVGTSPTTSMHRRQQRQRAFQDNV